MSKLRCLLYFFILATPIPLVSQEYASENKYGYGGDFTPSRQGGMNIRSLIDVSLRPNKWPKLLKNVAVLDDLECSDAQRQQIAEIQYRDPSTIQREDPTLSRMSAKFDRGSSPNVYYMNKEEFAPYLKRYTQLILEQESKQVKALSDILRPKQVRRLKQLQFQHNLLVLNNPRLALAVYDIELPPDEQKEIRRAARLANDAARRIHPRLTAEYRYEAVTRLLGNRAKGAYGELFIPSVMEGHARDFEALREIINSDGKKKKSNPRRK